MCKLSRSRLDEGGDAFGGTDDDGNSKDVKIDESYFGGKPRKDDDEPRRRGRGTSKTPVRGMVERKGRIKAVVVPDTKKKTITPIIEETVEEIVEESEFGVQSSDSPNVRNIVNK